MEFTYTATLAVNGQEEVIDVWRAAEYLQMQEAIKALNNRLLIIVHFLLPGFILKLIFNLCFFFHLEGMVPLQ